MGNRWWLLIVLCLLIGVFYSSGLERFFTLEALKDQHEALQQAYQARPLFVIGIYAATYIVMAGLSIPGAIFMTLTGGAMFGLWIGVPVVLVSATIGATLAFWMTRYVLRDVVQRHF